MANNADWTLDRVLAEMGAAGRRLSAMGAAEGAAGNISVLLPSDAALEDHFPLSEPVELPIAVPDLARRAFLVTGSGERLADLARSPLSGIAALRVEADGRTAQMLTAPERRFPRVTSEFNTHLAIHRHAAQNGSATHAIVHAQPIHLTFLSHIPGYRHTRILSESLLRWQPEIVMSLPEGVVLLPFEVPGSEALMEATRRAVQEGYRFIVWAKHGVLVCSDEGPKKAVDLIEYVETAARYEFMNLASGRPAHGLDSTEINAIAAALGIRTPFFQED